MIMIPITTISMKILSEFSGKTYTLTCLLVQWYAIKPLQHDIQGGFKMHQLGCNPKALQIHSCIKAGHRTISIRATRAHYHTAHAQGYRALARTESRIGRVVTI